MAEIPRFGQIRLQTVGDERIAEINRVIHDVRDITLVTEGPGETGRFEGHTTTLYSTITRRLNPGGRTIQVAWRSHEYDPDHHLNEHSLHIERDCRAAATLGKQALARVKFNLYESDSRDLSIKLFALARKIEDPDEAAVALDVVNDYRFGRVNDRILNLERDNEWGAPYSMYIADIHRVTVPTDIERFTPQGWVPINYGHAPVELEKLHGFDFPPRPPQDAA